MRGARHFSELTVWKLADELRVETLKLTKRPAFARNLKAQGSSPTWIARPTTGRIAETSNPSRRRNRAPSPAATRVTAIAPTRVRTLAPTSVRRIAPTRDSASHRHRRPFALTSKAPRTDIEGALHRQTLVGSHRHRRSLAPTSKNPCTDYRNARTGRK